MNDLTIAICTNNLNKTVNIALNGIYKLECRILIVLDTNVEMNNQSKFLNDSKLEIIKSTKNGLSNLRNIALEMCRTKFILFIDDDVLVNREAVGATYDLLLRRNGIVGVKLSPPEHIKILLVKCYISRNQYHYFSLHNNKHTEKSVWGAYMAFDMSIIKCFNITFDTNLGRKNSNYISGEDTEFINKLQQLGCTKTMIENHMVYHYIDEKRINFYQLFKRVYSQGITEYVRCNIKNGIRKEFSRNFDIHCFKEVLTGILWFSVFIIGIFIGFIKYGKK